MKLKIIAGVFIAGFLLCMIYFLVLGYMMPRKSVDPSAKAQSAERGLFDKQGPPMINP